MEVPLKKLFVVYIAMLLSSCNTLPQLYQAAEDIADDTAIKISISKEAIQKQTDVTISVEVKNNQAEAN